MERERKGAALVGLIVAHAVCCGGLVLVATGALGGLGAWLLGDGLTWILVAAGVAAAGYLLWRRRGHIGAAEVER